MTDGNAIKIIEQDGIASILKAMEQHHHSPGVQLNACAALQILIHRNGMSRIPHHTHHVEDGNPSNRKAIELIFRAIHRHENIEKLQRTALVAFYNLAKHSKCHRDDHTFSS